ncbi:aldo/keto reductase [Microbacterium immunditiarum]|uniref:Aryl-alcohol dehydrogenase (NADP+) n=1 Tax=Microbacterium immunditiarum TaxID=337480 RepID=A0A7Y9GML9_9MICO|nr:aldo/keto reductase [Microbacterium immunditiarum]NYE19294.1 aryl-alcohol dehydrogenase (NADP+) [Microbacterium immunditiarum]
MKHTRLGSSGLRISRIVLGCMSYGDPNRGAHAWSMGIDDARPLFRRAIEAGITTFDTANVYSLGSSEEITGQLLREFSSRDDVVIATKVAMRMGPGPKDSGLSRAAIMAQADASLLRLGTDYIDLYQIHRLDPAVPMEEIMEALHDLVRAGKVRYIGASSMWAWQFAKLQHTAERNGWTRFVSMQDQYNLLMREEEREMHPLCLDQGVGVIPWSPLARGRLSREWGTETARTATDDFGNTLYHQQEQSDRAIVDAVGAIAAERGVSRAQVGLAWVLSKQAVSAPIIGATKPHHLDEAIAAVDLELGEDEIARLEAPYTPRLPEGF